MYMYVLDVLNVLNVLNVCALISRCTLILIVLAIATKSALIIAIIGCVDHFKKQLNSMNSHCTSCGIIYMHQKVQPTIYMGQHKTKIHMQQTQQNKNKNTKKDSKYLRGSMPFNFRSRFLMVSGALGMISDEQGKKTCT